MICHTPFQLVMPRSPQIQISEELAEFTGLETNTEYPIVTVIRHVHEYIEANHLTDKNDPRIIVCDEKLKKLLNYDPATARIWKDGTPEILNHVNISRYLERHFIRDQKKIKDRLQENEAKEMKNSSLIRISSELAEFAGLKKNTKYPRIEIIRHVYKYIYEYIRVHELMSKKYPYLIVCDENLGKLLNYDHMTTPIRKDGTPEILNYFSMPKYLERHFIKDRKKKLKQKNADIKKMEQSENKVERSPGILRLRRCFACMPNSVDQEMKLVFFDLKNSSNSDISATSACFRRQTYRHPRARQLAAACKYGWMVTPTEAYAPEEFMSRLSSSTLNFEERARIRNKSEL